jgi:uncharacterized ion transporter superfamily protein YfcC
MKKAIIKKTPHTYVILFGLVLLASILTYIIPAGNFQRVQNEAVNQTVVVADSYKRCAGNPVAPWKIFQKFYEAFKQETTAELIFFIFIIGGAFEIFMQTGCIKMLSENILTAFENKRYLIIPAFVSFFSIFGFTMGLATASVIFVPIGIAAARALKFDKITGIAMVALGTNAGFAAGIYNPFSVGIAQSIAEVPIYSGAWIRWLLLIALIVVTSLYIMRYAKKHEEKYEELEVLVVEKQSINMRQKIVLAEFSITFIILTFGISRLQWEVENIVVIFLIMGIVVGLTAGFGINKVCAQFTDGCRKMMTGALVIGIASTMRLILIEGNILDTITYELTGLVYYMPGWAQLLGMFYSNAVIDTVITSGSAHAAVVMPIMTPMADFLGLSRQSAVFTFQLGDGLVNLFSPISTTLNGVLAVSDTTYGRWIRFYAPLVGIYMIVGTVFTILAGVIGY